MLKYIMGAIIILAASTAVMFLFFWQKPPSRRDSNNDQTPSPAEFHLAWTNMVRMIDLDSNGRITRQESQDFLHDHTQSVTKNLAMTSFFNRMNANGDDRLDLLFTKETMNQDHQKFTSAAHAA